MRRRGVLAGSAALLAPAIVRAQPLAPVRLGVLGDVGGMGAATSGPPVIAAVQLAIGDSGHLAGGREVAVLAETFRGRPDDALAIARRWLVQDQVTAILDVPGTTAAIEVQALATRLDRALLNTGSVLADLTEELCSVVATAWGDDVRAMAGAMARAAAQDGRRDWFLIHLDGVLSTLVQREASRAIQAAGGRVVGVSRRPEGAADFAPALAQARASGAAMIGLCDAGDTLGALLAQAHEAPAAATQTMAAFLGTLMDARRLGSAAEGVWLARSFYWNDSDFTRGFARRFLAMTGRMPDASHAAAFVATRHLLRAIAAGEGLDGVALNRVLRRVPAFVFGPSVRLSADGRVPRDMGVFRVRPAGVSEWDVLHRIATIPAGELYTVRATARCSRPG